MVTIADVAKHARVSKSTVSLVLNAKDKQWRVSESTRQKVLTSIQEMGYRPNALARHIATGKSNVIAVISKGFKHKYESEILSGAIDEATKSKFLIKTILIEENQTAEEIVGICQANLIAGVICRTIPPNISQSLFSALKNENIPYVSFEHHTSDNQWGIEICADEASGCRQLTRHLYSLGHRHIGIAAVHPTTRYSVMRTNEFIKCLNKLKIHVPENEIIIGKHFVDFEEHLNNYFSNTKSFPTAFLCISDAVAMILARCIWRAGLKIPDDISVTGFGNLPMGLFAYSPLTTVNEPYIDMGVMAVKHITEAIKLPDKGLPGKHALPVELIIRDSTRAI